MTLRGDILRATKAASEVYTASGARRRVEEDGYLRVNPIEIAAHAGLLVMLRPLESLLGAFLRMEEPGILLNCERSAGLIHMTCAHELGHFFMGHETTADVALDYGPDAVHTELEADAFAYHLLMPRELLVTIMRRKRWTKESLRNPLVLYQLSLRLGMSFSATVWSLTRQKVLTFDEASALAKIPPRRIKNSLAPDVAAGVNDVWVLDPDDRNAVLEPRSSDVFLAELPDHAAAGYLWTLDDAQREGFTLRPIALEPSPQRDSIWLGGGTSRRYYLDVADHARAAEGGRPAQLDFMETQPWQREASGANRFATVALFEQIRSGLSDASKSAVLEEARQYP